jgi:hypothetical protein
LCLGCAGAWKAEEVRRRLGHLEFSTMEESFLLLNLDTEAGTSDRWNPPINFVEPHLNGKCEDSVVSCMYMDESLLMVSVTQGLQKPGIAKRKDGGLFFGELNKLPLLAACRFELKRVLLHSRDGSNVTCWNKLFCHAKVLFPPVLDEIYRTLYSALFKNSFTICFKDSCAFYATLWRKGSIQLILFIHI